MSRLKEMIEVEFLADVEVFEKGKKYTFSKSIATQLVNTEKVAKFAEKTSKKVKEPKTEE